MRMNMSDFATFFAVARNQSFRAAGDELGLSSSAISHSIKTLEQRLKIRLFNRTTRSVSLTEAGSNLYERLRPAFDEIQIMLDEMNDFRLTPTGTLKINAARVAARIFLMSLLVGFTREYPDIKVELTTDDSLVDIVQQGFDAGVRLSCIVEKDMISVAIAPPVKLCVAATPEYFANMANPAILMICLIINVLFFVIPAANLSTGNLQRSWKLLSQEISFWMMLMLNWRPF